MIFSRYLPHSFAVTALVSATTVLVPLAIRAEPGPAPATKPVPATAAPKLDTSKPDTSKRDAAEASPSADDVNARMKADRDAFFSARLAALHAGLQLTPDQQGLWPPVETAIRDLVATRRAYWQQGEDKNAGSSIDLLMARGEHLIRMGGALKKLAAATSPLVRSLTADQKERLPMLLHGVNPGWVMARAFDLRDDRVAPEGRDRAGHVDMRRDDLEHGGRDGIDQSDNDKGDGDHSRMERGEMDREGGYETRRDRDAARYGRSDPGDGDDGMRWRHHHRHHHDEDDEG